MFKLNVLAALCLIPALFACSDDDPFVDAPDNTGGDGGVVDTTGDGGGGPDAVENEFGPVIVVVSPTAATTADLTSEQIVTVEHVTARCEVSAMAHAGHPDALRRKLAGCQTAAFCGNVHA